MFASMASPAALGTVLGALMGGVIGWYGMVIVRRKTSDKPLRKTIFGAMVVCIFSLTFSWLLAASFSIVGRKITPPSVSFVYGAASAIVAVAPAAVVVALVLLAVEI